MGRMGRYDFSVGNVLFRVRGKDFKGDLFLSGRRTRGIVGGS